MLDEAPDDYEDGKIAETFASPELILQSPETQMNWAN